MLSFSLFSIMFYIIYCNENRLKINAIWEKCLVVYVILFALQREFFC